MSYSQTVNAAVASNQVARTSSGAPPRPRGSSSATNAPQAESTGRLRGSCECCAKSKVKCGKEKPTCARCAARGTHCIYLESRRPGRVAGQHYGRTNPRPRIDRDAIKRHDSFVQPRSPTQRQNSIVSSTASGQTSPHVEVAPMYPMLPEAATNAHGLGLSDATSSVIGSMTSSSVDPSPTAEYPLDWGFDFNDMMIDAGSLDLTMEQNPIFSNFMDLGDTQGVSNLWPTYDDGSNTGNSSNSGAASNTVSNMSQFTFPADGAKVASDNFSPLSSPLSSSSSAVDLGNLNSLTAQPLLPDVNMNTLPMVTELDTVDEAPQSNESCDCASQALEILKTLSRSQSPGPPSGRRRPSSSSILSTNKESAEGIIGLLACPRCTEDRFLLATSLMIAMKLLGRYASVAASWSSNTSSPVLSANPSFGGRASSVKGNLMTPMSGMSRTTSSTSVATTADLEEVSPREAIQSVLRELHRVQRLIAQLPGRIANSEGQQSTTNLFSTSFTDQQNISPTDMLGDIIPTPPLSARALSQVEEDVRTSLKELSANLRNSLNSC